jgi:hypothetical protein
MKRLTEFFDGGCPRRETVLVSLLRLPADTLRGRVAETSSAQMAGRAILPLMSRYLAILGFGAVLVSACGPRSAADMSAAEKTAIADSLKHLVVGAYDLSKPDVVARLMSLYPASGRVISASGGVVTTTRPQLQQAIQAFWTYVGQNMKQPRWEWTSMTVDVLAPDAAVMTSTYRVPHLTPMGMNHVIGGAWTAVFQKRSGKWVIIQEHLSDVQSNPNLQANP